MTDKEAQLKAKLLKMRLAATKRNWDSNETTNKRTKQKNKVTDDLREQFSKPTAKNEHEFDPSTHGTHVRNIMYPESEDECSQCGKTSGEHKGFYNKEKTRKPYKIKDYNFDTGKFNTAKAKVKKLKKKTSIPDEIMQEASDAAGLNKNQSPSYIAQEHNHKISFRGHKIGGFKSASLNEQSGKYAKYWLLNAKETNGNGWGIAAHTAKENMKKFIGRPLVVTAQSWHGASEYGEEYEHPYLPTNDINAILNHQEKFRVGSIVDVFEDKQGDWFASVEMLPKFASSRLPPFCSPAIYQLDAAEAEGQISKWEALHLAALTENPAYGARIALLKGTCVGTDNECKVQFKSAKQESGIECPVKEKQKKVKSKISKLKTKQKISSLKQRLATVPSNLPTPSRNPFNKRDKPDEAIDQDVYFSDKPSGLNDIDPNRNRKRKPTSFDDKYDPNRLPMAEDFMGQGEGPDRKVGDTVRDKLPNIPASRLEGTGPDTYHTRNEGESELSFKRWEDTAIEGHKFPGDKEVDEQLRSLFDGPFKSEHLHPSGDDVEVDTEVEWNLDEYYENQGDVPLKETKTTNVYDNSLASIYGLAEEGFTGKYEDRFIVGDPRKWEQAKRKLQQYMPIGDNDPDDILNFMLDRGIDSFSNKGISDVSRKNAERFSKLKKKQKISKLKARLAFQDVSEPFKFAPPKEPYKLHSRSKEIEEHGLKTIGESDNFNGGHFLTTDGRLIGTGKSEHRDMSHSILKTFDDKDFNDMAENADSKQMSRWGTDGRNMQELLQNTGMARVSTGLLGDVEGQAGINIDTSHPLSKKQRSRITQYLEDNNVSPDNVFIDDYTNTQSIRKQLRLGKLKLKLANLGEQNMTYQDSKKVKIHKKKHPEVRKASLASEFAHDDIEGVLRGIHSSPLPPDKREHQSSFLSSTGDYIGGGEDHTDTIKSIFKDKTFTPEDKANDGPVTRFSTEHRLPRVQRRVTRRGGRVSFGIHAPVNSSQLRSMKDVEAGGEELAFVVGKDTNGTVGEGYRDLTKALRENKFLG